MRSHRFRRRAAAGVLILAPIVVFVLLVVAGARIRSCLALYACRDVPLVSEPIIYYGALLGAGVAAVGWLVTLIATIGSLRRGGTPAP